MHLYNKIVAKQIWCNNYDLQIIKVVYFYYVVSNMVVCEVLRIGGTPLI